PVSWLPLARKSGTHPDRYRHGGANAWYQANSKDHAWSCGSLLPNDLGLFDMLGNEFEWVQDSTRRSLRARRGLSSDRINILEYINEKTPRLRGGGSFPDRPAIVRSALGGWAPPASRGTYYGFRPSRTYY